MRGALPLTQIVQSSDGGSPPKACLADETQPWGYLTWVSSEQVVLDPQQTGYIGAEAHTNNTGELSAMDVALRRALARRAGEGAETIWSDSLYAINMTTGRWMLDGCRALADAETWWPDYEECGGDCNAQDRTRYTYGMYARIRSGQEMKQQTGSPNRQCNESRVTQPR